MPSQVVCILWNESSSSNCMWWENSVFWRQMMWLFLLLCLKTARFVLFNVRIVFILREKGVALRFTTAVFASSQAIADPNLKNCDTPLVVLHPRAQQLWLVWREIRKPNTHKGRGDPHFVGHCVVADAYNTFWKTFLYFYYWRELVYSLFSPEYDYSFYGLKELLPIYMCAVWVSYVCISFVLLLFFFALRTQLNLFLCFFSFSSSSQHATILWEG